jgi:hypothetical protein
MFMAWYLVKHMENFTFISHILVVLLTGFLTSGFPTKILYVFLTFFLTATYSSHVVHPDVIVLIIRLSG